MRRLHGSLTPAERKVARVVLSNYPVAALESVSRLAGEASVSGPTVLRLAHKLGFSGYPDMQAHLHAEIANRTMSPLDLYREQPPTGTRVGQDEVLARAQRRFEEGLASTFRSLPPSEFERTIDLLADLRKRIIVIGGRFSTALSAYFARHLQLLRPSVVHVSTDAAARSALLLDVGTKDVVVAFDFRRYQRDTVYFATEAVRRGAVLALFTDPWQSPAAHSAEVVLSASVTAPSPFDSIVAPLAVVETCIAGLVERLGDEPRERVAEFDELQAELIASEEDDEASDAAPR
jgi:DNA-binding MurR/RpiR family transcriptional regulator